MVYNANSTRWTKQRSMHLIAYNVHCRASNINFAKTREQYMSKLFGKAVTEKAINAQFDRIASRFGMKATQFSECGLDAVRLYPNTFDSEELEELRAALQMYGLIDDVSGACSPMNSTHTDLDKTTVVNITAAKPHRAHENIEHEPQVFVNGINGPAPTVTTSPPPVGGTGSIQLNERVPAATVARPTPSPLTSPSMGSDDDNTSTINQSRRVPAISPALELADSAENTQAARHNQRKRFSNNVMNDTASQVTKRPKHVYRAGRRASHTDSKKSAAKAVLPPTPMNKPTFQTHRVDLAAPLLCTSPYAPCDDAQSPQLEAQETVMGQRDSLHTVGSTDLPRLDNLNTPQVTNRSSQQQGHDRRLKDKAKWFDDLFSIVVLEREPSAAFPDRVYLPKLIRQWDALAWELVSIRDGRIRQHQDISLVDVPHDFYRFLITVFGPPATGAYFSGGPMPRIKPGSITQALLKSYASYSLCLAAFGSGIFGEDRCMCLQAQVLNEHRKLLATTNGIDDLHMRELAVLKRLAITGKGLANELVSHKAEKWATQICDCLAVFEDQSAMSTGRLDERRTRYTRLFEKMVNYRLELIISSTDYQLSWTLVGSSFNDIEMQGVDSELGRLRDVAPGEPVGHCIFPALYQYDQGAKEFFSQTTEDIAKHMPMNKSFIPSNDTSRAGGQLAGRAYVLVRA